MYKVKKFLFSHRFGEVITLIGITAKFLQCEELLFGLYTFGDCAHFHYFGEVDDGLDHQSRGVILEHLVYETFIDL